MYVSYGLELTGHDLGATAPPVVETATEPVEAWTTACTANTAGNVFDVEVHRSSEREVAAAAAHLYLRHRRCTGSNPRPKSHARAQVTMLQQGSVRWKEGGQKAVRRYNE